jgi:hypothetical protein
MQDMVIQMNDRQLQTLPRRHPRAQPVMRREYAVKTRQVHSRACHQGGQTRQKIQRLEHHERRAVAVRGLQCIADLTMRGERQPLGRHRRAADVGRAASLQTLECTTSPTCPFSFVASTRSAPSAVGVSSRIGGISWSGLLVLW